MLGFEQRFDNQVIRYYKNLPRASLEQLRVEQTFKSIIVFNL